jgi:hypothetical protein
MFPCDVGEGSEGSAMELLADGAVAESQAVGSGSSFVADFPTMATSYQNGISSHDGEAYLKPVISGVAWMNWFGLSRNRDDSCVISGHVTHMGLSSSLFS